MSLADTASALLEKNGEPVVIDFPPTTPAYDPITGAAQSPVAGASITANGYPSAYQNREIDGTVIQANDIRLILELIATKPDRGAHATIDGTKYRIMNTQAIRKAGADVLYICQLRAN